MGGAANYFTPGPNGSSYVDPVKLFDLPRTFRDADGLMVRFVFPEYYGEEYDSDEDDEFFIVSQTERVPSRDYYPRALRVRWRPETVFSTGDDFTKKDAKYVKSVSKQKFPRAPNVGSCSGSCVCDYSNEDLKDLLKEMNVPQRSKLTNRYQRCKVLEHFENRGLILRDYPLIRPRQQNEIFVQIQDDRNDTQRRILNEINQQRIKQSTPRRPARSTPPAYRSTPPKLEQQLSGLQYQIEHMGNVLDSVVQQSGVKIPIAPGAATPVQRKLFNTP